MHVEDDDQEDLSQLDRGDVVVDETVKKEAEEEQAKKDLENIKKKDDDTADPDKKGDEVVEGADKKEDDTQDRDAKGRFKKKDEDEEDGEDEDEDARKQNFPIRLDKAKRQRAAAEERAERAERELAELKRAAEQRTKVDPVDEIRKGLDELYVKVEEARADGNTKEAARIQREIDEANRKISAHESARVAAATSNKVASAAKFDAMLDILEEKMPVLNPDADEFDDEAVAELETLVQAYERLGMPSPDALRKAVKVLFREDPFGRAPPKKAEEVKKEADKKELDKKPDPKKTDIRKAVDTQKKQPPDTSAAGVNKGDDPKINVAVLSDDEFDALPESKRKELRGDYI